MVVPFGLFAYWLLDDYVTAVLMPLIQSYTYNRRTIGLYYIFIGGGVWQRSLILLKIPR
jgi:hypothetical protein